MKKKVTVGATMKLAATIVLFIIATSTVFAWGEGNTEQSYYIHWQPQEETCSIPGTFYTLPGYEWTNRTTNSTVCIPFGTSRGHVSQHSGDTETLQGTSTQTPNTTQVPQSNISLSIKDPFPQGADYVFICNGSDLNQQTVSYDWDFGDGSKLYDLSSQDVFHTFEDPGQYQVTCVANDFDNNIASWLSVTVTPQQTTPRAMLFVNQQAGTTFDLICQQRGFFPTHFDWEFGDGTSITTTTNEVLHTFHDGNADHTINCTARNNTTAVSDFIIVHS